MDTKIIVIVHHNDETITRVDVLAVLSPKDATRLSDEGQKRGYWTIPSYVQHLLHQSFLNREFDIDLHIIQVEMLTNPAQVFLMDMGDIQ